MNDNITETNDLHASIMVKNRNNVWIDDNMVYKCGACCAEFGIFKRKHHCRSCGNIFCHDCCNNYIVIPNFITDRPNPEDYWNISYYISSIRDSKERTCDSCYKIIKHKNDMYDQIINIFEIPKSIEYYLSNPMIDNSIRSHYIEYLRNIQYYLPKHEYTSVDINILLINAPFFVGHSKYIMHLLKAIPWNTNESSKYLHTAIDVLNGDRIMKCSDLLCTRTCQTQLSCDDCVNILFTTTERMPLQIIDYLFDIIANTPETVILCHLTFFVDMIIKNIGPIQILSRIHAILSKTKKLIYHTYWLLTNLKSTATKTELITINFFINMFDKKIVKKMLHEYLFFEGLIKNITDVKQYLLIAFDQHKPITLPYDPSYKIVSVDYDSIIVKQSQTKPIIIDFEIETKGHVDKKKIKLLFKNESVMNDVTVINLMTLCDIILTEYMDPEFEVVVYPTMPLTANSGMIEIVRHAKTIHDISLSGNSILQHIISQNESNIVSEILDRYMYSLVAYTLQSYFIGLGDRHTENIMITNDGRIFHIDFGYILGADAYPITTSEIRLNSEMIDVIGGATGIRYKKYLNLCSKGAILLRKYFNMFYILLSQYSRFDQKYINDFILNRFQPRQIDASVVEELLSIIKKSNDAYGTYIRDFLHYHSQEKTVQHGISGILRSTLDAISRLGN